MKFTALALAAALSIGSAAQAATFTGVVGLGTNPNILNPGFQVRVNVLKNSGPQGFSSSPISFDLDNVGDSDTVDLFVFLTFEGAVDADDLSPLPFDLDFSIDGFGSDNIDGTTAGVIDGVNQFGLADFLEDGFINLGDGTAILITLADTEFGNGVNGLSTGKVNGSVISATFELAAIPVPAALPLFLSALGLMGFIGRRRQIAA